MRTLGIPDIVGPVMVGPSSSHTAGALRIAAMTRALLDRPPADVTFTLYGSFSRTYRGHGTDRALVAGLLGFAADDLRIRDSFKLAQKAGLSFRFEVDPRTKVRHPNTVDLRVTDVDGDVLEVRGESIGGGAARLVRVDGFEVDLTGEFSALIVYQCDRPGTLGFLATTLGRHDINIGSVLLFRNHRGGDAFNVLEVDNPVPQEVLDEIQADSRVSRVRLMPAADLAEHGVEGPGSDDVAPVLAPAEAEARFRKVDYEDGTALLAYAEAEGVTLGQAFLAREELRLAMQGSRGDAGRPYLRRALDVMRESVRLPLARTPQTMGGLIGRSNGPLEIIGSTVINLRFSNASPSSPNYFQVNFGGMVGYAFLSSSENIQMSGGRLYWNQVVIAHENTVPLVANLEVRFGGVIGVASGGSDWNVDVDVCVGRYTPRPFGGDDRNPFVVKSMTSDVYAGHVLGKEANPPQINYGDLYARKNDIRSNRYYDIYSEIISASCLEVHKLTGRTAYTGRETGPSPSSSFTYYGHIVGNNNSYYNQNTHARELKVNVVNN